MTSIYRLEGKPFIYSSEKPFPIREEAEHLSAAELSFRIHSKTTAVDLWYSQATKTPVKPGLEIMFNNYIGKDLGHFGLDMKDFYNKLNEGVELDPSCFKIEKVPIYYKDLEDDPFAENERCVAVFVTPVVDHATLDNKIKGLKDKIIIELFDERDHANENTTIISYLEQLHGYLSSGETKCFDNEYDQQDAKELAELIRKLKGPHEKH